MLADLDVAADGQAEATRLEQAGEERAQVIDPPLVGVPQKHYIIVLYVFCLLNTAAESK